MKEKMKLFLNLWDKDAFVIQFMQRKLYDNYKYNSNKMKEGVKWQLMKQVLQLQDKNNIESQLTCIKFYLMEEELNA